MTESIDIKISILTPCVRPEGLEIVKKALDNQKFRNFEWLIGSKFNPNIGKWISDDFSDGFWSLNRIYTKMIKEAKGELIVSWQDFTWADEKTLDKFWYCYELEPNTLVSAVGDKYTDETWQNKTWTDPRKRKDLGNFYPCYPSDIEWNLNSCPKEALDKIGYFDDEMDFIGLGMDGYGVNERIDTLGGYDFKLNQSIESFSIGHGRSDNWEKDNLIHGGYIKRKKELIDKGQWPIIANYKLKS